MFSNPITRDRAAELFPWEAKQRELFNFQRSNGGMVIFTDDKVTIANMKLCVTDEKQEDVISHTNGNTAYKNYVKDDLICCTINTRWGLSALQHALKTKEEIALHLLKRAVSGCYQDFDGGRACVIDISFVNREYQEMFGMQITEKPYHVCVLKLCP